MNLTRYNKFWAALAAALVVLGAALSDGHVSGAEVVQILAAFLGSFTVYQVTNTK